MSRTNPAAVLSFKPLNRGSKGEAVPGSGRTEEGKKLSMEIASGVLRIFQRISAAMPDEVNQLMTLMTLVQ